MNEWCQEDQLYELTVKYIGYFYVYYKMHRGQSGEIPAQRIGADQHSPAREACLLTCRGRFGLGAEARASEVRPQGEDWGGLREHSLKGASAP